MYIARLDDDIYTGNATCCALAHTKSRALAARRTPTTTGSPFVCTSSRWQRQRGPHLKMIAASEAIRDENNISESGAMADVDLR